MNPCTHPRSVLGWCERSAPCLGDECGWEAAQRQCAPPEETSISIYKNRVDWKHAKDCEDTLVSPCGRFEITRIRVTILGRRYSAWDKHPADAEGLPTLAGVFDSAADALRSFHER